MGYDRKYGNITTEFGDIPDDEPVLVLRGRDLLAAEAFNAYLRACLNHPCDAHHLRLVQDSLIAFQAWQTANPRRLVTPSSSGPAGQSYFQRNR